MTRTIFSKVMWVGRATVFLVGLAVILALVFGVATTALAGTGVGASFNLGKTNTVNAISKLVGSTASSMLMVDNNGTGTALDLKVGDPNAAPATKQVAPMKVDSQAEVANLNAQFAGQADNAAHADSADSATNATSAAEAGNADTLDNMDSTAFLGANAKAADADKLDGKDSTQFVGSSTTIYDNQITISGAANSFRQGSATCNSGDKVLSGGFYGLDGTSYIQASYRNGQGWYIQYWDGGSTATDLTVFAVCADV